MLVCRHGHVVTDRLRTSPERGLSHCDRCGAATLSSCPTCGQDLPGATIIPGMSLVGVRTPPEHCPACGAAFPWAGLGCAAPGLVAVLVLLGVLLTRRVSKREEVSDGVGRVLRLFQSVGLSVARSVCLVGLVFISPIVAGEAATSQPR